MALKEFDEINALQTAERKGEERGIEKGLQQGLEQGIEKGIEKVATNLLKAEIDIKTIIASTGLRLEDIEKLKKALV